MRHIAAHRWADLAAGRLPDAEAEELRDHARRCSRCARARDRVTGGHAALAEIARAPTPELGWDHIGARIYWAVSSEQRARQRATPRRPAHRWFRVTLLVAATAAAATAATALMVRDRGVAMSFLGHPPAPSASPCVGCSAEPPPPSVAPAAPAMAAIPVELVTSLRGVVTLVAGEVDIDGATAVGDVLDRPVIAGSRLRTAEGRVGVQFGAGSGFAVGPSSSVTLRHFDASNIELVVNEGELAVEVAPRQQGQRFSVVAGDRVIEVRGTAFEVVRRDRALQVRCSHGRVAIVDRRRADEVEVDAGHALALPDGEPLHARRPQPLSAAALASLAAAQAPRLPVWTDAAHVHRTTGALEVAAPRGRAVRVDGVMLGHGAMTLRVMSGRHLVEAQRAPGRWITGQWIDVGTGTFAVGFDGDRDVEPALSPEAAAAAARTTRQAQLDRQLDQRRVAACLRAVTKQGIPDTFVELEVGVDATGAIRFLNIAKTDLPRFTAACVRDAVASVRFPRGVEATWRHKLTF